VTAAESLRDDFGLHRRYTLCAPGHMLGLVRLKEALGRDDLAREVRILHRKMEESGEAKECFHGMVKRVMENAVDSLVKGYSANTGEVYVASRLIEIR
jgi:hypothetical protein